MKSSLEMLESKVKDFSLERVVHYYLYLAKLYKQSNQNDLLIDLYAKIKELIKNSEEDLIQGKEKIIIQLEKKIIMVQIETKQFTMAIENLKSISEKEKELFGPESE